MREIKFRAWHKTTNKMFEVFSFSDDFVFEKSIDGVHTSATLPANRTDCELIQFIGRIDKDGKEIYEGHIVRVDCSDVAGSLNDGVYIVEYILPDCSFSLIQLDKQHGIQFNECYNYEIIGNIHENPELL